MAKKLDAIKKKLKSNILAWKDGKISGFELMSKTEATLEMGWYEEPLDLLPAEAVVDVCLNAFSSPLLFDMRKEDVPAYIKLINAPRGKENEALDVFDKYWYGVDTEKRSKEFTEDELNEYFHWKKEK